jgi:hypothetical protein
MNEKNNEKFGIFEIEFCMRLTLNFDKLIFFNDFWTHPCVIRGNSVEL